MIYTIDQASARISQLTRLSRNEPIDTDIGTVFEISLEGKKRIHSSVSNLNREGYTPFFSMIVGSLRICENLIAVVDNFAKMIFLQQNLLTTTIKLKHNFIQIVRSSIEMIPGLGNVILYTIDQLRILYIERQIELETHQLGTRSYYSNGRLISTGNLNELYENDFNFMAQAGAGFS